MNYAPSLADDCLKIFPRKFDSLLKQASVSAPVESKEKQNIIYLKKALIFQFLYLQQIEDNPAIIGDFQTKQLLRAGSALPILWST